MKYLLLLLVISLLSACNNSSEKSKEESIPKIEWEFEIDFPETGFPLNKTKRTNPEFPESNVLNWTMTGETEAGFFMYFIAKDVLGKDLQNDVKALDYDYDEVLKLILGGGMKNFSGENIQYEKIKSDTLQAMKATADYILSEEVGSISSEAYTNGYQILIIGAVTQKESEIDRDNFFKSLRISNKQ